MQQSDPLPELDAPALRRVLQRAMGQGVGQVDDWQITPISGGWESKTRLYKVAGHVRIDDGLAPWTLVLKIAQSLPERDAPEQWNYWRREPLLYESGLLEDLPNGVAAARCYGVETRDDQSMWIWLEALADAGDVEWNQSDYGEVARQFGRFNGAYLAGRPLPQSPFISRNWLRSYVESYAPVIARLPELRKDALVSRAVPESLANDLARLYAVRESLLEGIEALPQTFCHLDAWRRNLFITQDAAGKRQIKAIDWQFAGVSAIGHELAALVFSHADADMEKSVLDGYLEGLHAAGWKGDHRQVWLGYTVAMVFQYGLAGMGFVVNMLFDARERDHQMKSFDKPLEEIVDMYQHMVAFPMSHIDQALALLKNVLHE